jgi:ATP-binding cassette subfamily B (MDR/TAP) protein 1
LAIAEFTLIYMTTAGFYVVGERISRRLRMAYLRAVIRQNMAFFDQIEAGEVTSSLTTDVNRIQESITSKLSLSLTAAATFGASLAIAFSIHWQLASILTVGMLFVGFAETLGGRLSIRHSTEALRYYHKSTAVVEEAISSMRNVAALGLQQAMEHRQAAHINLAQAAGLRARLSVALMISVLNAAPYFIYGLATWCGVHFISDSSLAATGVIQITMAIVAGAFALGRVAPAMESFISGIASARTLFQTIARRPPFDPFSKKGTTLVEAKGTITLRDVSLVYPSRPGVTVLEKLSCNFPALQTTALVGGSGSGKSSVVGLIARLYEPTEGNVCELCLVLSHENELTPIAC